MRSASDQHEAETASAFEENASDADLSARPQERFLEPPTGRRAARLRFAGMLALALLVHVALIVAFLWRDAHDRAQVAKIDEIPVEIVQEPPPEPPKPPPPPEPKPPPPPKPKEDLRPAFSAPRAPSEQQVETQRTQEKNAAPSVQPKPQEGKPAPQEAAAPPHEAAPAQSKQDEAAKEEDTSKPDAEALDKAKPKASKQPPKTKEAKATTKHKQKPTNDLLASLAAPAFAPDVSFAKPTPKTKVYGGTEDVRWMAEVEGMLESKVSQLPRNAHWQSGGKVVVFFHVDASGRVISREIYQKSGYPEIDALAMRALAAAAPFPPPPPGIEHGLVWVTKFDGQLPTIHVNKN